jgi:hypothetical protein
VAKIIAPAWTCVVPCGDEKVLRVSSRFFKLLQDWDVPCYAPQTDPPGLPIHFAPEWAVNTYHDCRAALQRARQFGQPFSYDASLEYALRRATRDPEFRAALCAALAVKGGAARFIKAQMKSAPL